MQEHRGADALVEVLGGLAEPLELVARGEHLGGRGPGDQVADRAVADRRVGLVMVSIRRFPRALIMGARQVRSWWSRWLPAPLTSESVRNKNA